MQKMQELQHHLHQQAASGRDRVGLTHENVHLRFMHPSVVLVGSGLKSCLGRYGALRTWSAASLVDRGGGY